MKTEIKVGSTVKCRQTLDACRFTDDGSKPGVQTMGFSGTVTAIVGDILTVEDGKSCSSVHVTSVLEVA